MFHKIISRFSEYKFYLLLFAVIILFVLVAGFNGLYGQDSYEYLRFTNALIEFAKHGINPGKGYWPMLYPACGAVFSFLFKPVVALQLVSITSLLLSGIYLEKILAMLYKMETCITRLFVVIFFLFSPYLLRASLTIMSDSLCLFFITVSIYSFLKYKEGKRNIYFVGFAFLATAAIATRYAAFVVLIIPAIFTAWYFLKNFNLKGLVFSGLAIMSIVLPYIFIHKTTSVDFLHHEWLQSWAFKNMFYSAFDTADGYAAYSFPNILYCFFNLVHPAYCFAGIIVGIASIIVFIKKGTSYIQWISFASLLLYAFFLSGIPFQNMRFLILSFPFVIILFFPGFIDIYSFLKKAKPRIITPLIVFCIFIQSGLFVRVFIPFYHDNKIERQVSNEVIRYNAATLYTFSVDAAVRYYGFKGKIINMWEVKLDTLPSIHENELVLFNEKQFSEPWKNKNPMLNWEYLKTKFQLTKVKDLPNDWELYSIGK